MARQLTAKGVERFKVKPGRAYTVWDAGAVGLGLKITPAGRRIWVLQLIFPGRRAQTKRTLAHYPAMGLKEARAQASLWYSWTKQGIDPKDKVAEAQRALALKRANTFASVAERYIEHIHRQRQRKAEVVERALRREFIAPWGPRLITDITKADVKAVIRATVNRGATYQAFNLFGLVKRLYNWAIAQDDYGLDTSPCDRLKPKDVIGEKRHRERVLSDDELRAFWRVTEKLPYPWGPYFQILVLTGQRRSEWSGARWAEIDMNANRLTVPPERFKSNVAHLVPLTDPVLALLRTLPRSKKGDHLFSTTLGMKPIAGFAKTKRRLDALMVKALRALATERGEDPEKVQLEPFVTHDLRRTVRTRLSALRVPDAVAEMVIGHGRKGIQRVYDQNKFEPEMREALAAWASRLRDIVEPPPANVVPLRAG